MKRLMFWLALVGLSSCTPVLFVQPQPTGVANETFPSAWKGIYLMDKDTVTIGEDYFLTTETTSGTLEKDDNGEIITEGFVLKDGIITQPGSQPPVSGSYTELDGKIEYTLVEHKKITLGDSLVYRKLNDYYFLNMLQEQGQWQVIRLEPRKDGSILLYLTDFKEELTALKKKMKVEEVLREDGATDYYLANPSAKQFKKFVFAGGFRQELGTITPLRP